MITRTKLDDLTQWEELPSVSNRSSSVDVNSILMIKILHDLLINPIPILVSLFYFMRMARYMFNIAKMLL